jgi:hypothetical protein
VEFLQRHLPDELAVEPGELVDVEDGGRAADPAEVKGLDELLEGELLPLRARVPAEQGDVVDDGLLEVALLDEVGVGGVAVSLGELVLGVASLGGLRSGADTMELLLSAGADRNAVSCPSGRSPPAGETALDVAVRYRSPDFVAFLKSRGCRSATP